MPEFRAARTTARDQFLGAAVGGLTGLCTFFAFGQSLAVAVYALAVVLAMLVCWAMNVAVATVWLAGRLPAAHFNSQPRP